MRLYKGQTGPVLDEKAYAAALRELAKKPGLCSAESHNVSASESDIHMRVAQLSDRELVSSTQIAAQLSQADEAFAEYWFIRRLGFTS